ncbi:serine hydrolase domain-containing protein [Paenibacillus sp. UNC217MF]|nr:serine hydrolase domain-containing protein [Paenibacillus sp. UNC217MF]EPY11215.1 hypothetical protein PAAL66ix_19459 [Paenibacillus alvei A6-6i-x]
MHTKIRNPIIILLISMLFPVFLLPAYATDTTNAGNTPSGIPYERLEQEIDSYVNAHVGKATPGAAVVVTKGDKIIFSKGYGYANIEKKTEVDPAKTVFAYGSINKAFVWTSVMQLVEAGKMKLDQDIRAYLQKELAERLSIKKRITMLDIMSHTAGFEQHPLSTFTMSEDNLTSLEETLISSQPAQIYEPGKVIAYSNFATALAGLVVEKVSGESFSDYEMNHILRPLGMNLTSGHPTLEDRPELQNAEATGYAMKPEGGFEARAHYFVPMYPAGAMEGTAEDLARFAIALNAPSSPLFTRPETVQTMLSQSYTPNAEILSNAHGFWEYRAKPHTVGHSGNVKGFSGNFAVVPDEQLGIVVLTNMEIEQKLTSGIINLLIQDKTQEAVTPADDLAPSSELNGYYVQSGGTFTTYHEVINYLGLIKVEAKGKHDLTLSVMGMSGEMRQIKPNVYKYAKSDNPRFERLAPVLYAKISKDGQVVRLSKGIATDILPLQGSRSLPALTSYLVLAVIAIAFFLLTPFVLLVRWLFRKRKGSPSASTSTAPSSRLLMAVIWCGTILVVNILYLLVNAMINENVTVGQMNVGVSLNWVLATLAAALFVLSIFKGRHQVMSKGHKGFRIVVGVLFTSFALLLANWNFFYFIP